MLGRLRMSVDETIKAYCHLMSETYPRKKSIVGGDSTVAKTIKLEEGLRAIIGAATGAPEEGMLEGNPNEAKCKVYVQMTTECVSIMLILVTCSVIYAMPARNANTSPPCAFRTYPTTVSVMPDCPIWKALRASTAHPELFKHIEIEEFGTGYRFTNGSYGCSNPSALLLKEIIALFPGRSVASLVSIGAGHVDTNRIAQSTWLERALPSGGPITPRILRTAHGIVTDNERTAEHMDVSFSRIKNAYYRLNVDAGVQDIQSCEWEKQSQVADGTRVYVQQDEVHKRLGKLVAAVQERPALATIKLGAGILKSSNRCRIEVDLRWFYWISFETSSRVVKMWSTFDPHVQGPRAATKKSHRILCKQRGTSTCVCNARSWWRREDADSSQIC